MGKLLVFAGMGMEMAGLIYVAFLVGRWLDETYHTKGLIFAGLALTFLAAWLVQIIWTVRLLNKSEEKDEPSP